MALGILRARAILRGAPSTAVAYELLHKRAIAAQVVHGVPVTIHIDPTPVAARIDDGRWLIDCTCGAGAATDPDWGVARCFECGAVYQHVVFPDAETLAVIEDVLVQRPTGRYWFPDQRVEDLQAENRARGLPASSREKEPS